MSKNKWPENCTWPEPIWDGEGDFWEAEDAWGLALDEDGEDLLDIKEYMDGLVAEGRLNADYTLSEDYDADDGTDWSPEKGEDYWDDGFDVDLWEGDLGRHLNLLKLPLPSPADEIGRVICYEFINENLLRQAFTRKAFGLEYGVGHSEELEFIGDSVLNAAVTREMTGRFTELNCIRTESPFRVGYDAGEMTRIRTHYVSREHLASRFAQLGLGQYILGEDSEKAREDTMEALIGAIAVDCGWDWETMEGAIDRLLCLQLMKPNRILKETYYDLFNAWHQKHFGCLPKYEVWKKPNGYDCTIRFELPENDQGIPCMQRIDIDSDSRSGARELAAELAYRTAVNSGLWMNLRDADITLNLDDSINRLQELYQKKYVEQPDYTFREGFNGWECDCVCSGIKGYGRAESKTKAKKQAAYEVLGRLLKASGG